MFSHISMAIKSGKWKYFCFQVFTSSWLEINSERIMVFWERSWTENFWVDYFWSSPKFTSPHIASFSLVGPRLWTRRCTLFFLWLDHVLYQQMFVNPIPLLLLNRRVSAKLAPAFILLCNILILKNFFEFYFRKKYFFL